MPLLTRRPWTVAVVALMILAACGNDEPEATPDSPSTTDASASATSTTGSDAPGDPELDGPANGTGGGGGAPMASAGCGTSAAGAVVEEEHTLSVDDTERRYLRTVPGAHDGETPLPVVLDFHGLMEGAEIHAGMSAYSALADEEGFVAVFPHGTGEPVRWNVTPRDLDGIDFGDDVDVDAEIAEGADDLGYVDAMLAQLGDELCLDEARIYATGLSNGAMFTSLLACERADVVAAAVMVAGIEDPAGCDPARVVPVMTLHGTADPILLFNGGVDISAIPGMGPEGGPTATLPEPDLDGEGYPAAAAAWATRNGCDPDAVDTELTDEVIHRVWGCPPGADVELYIIVGGGHSWPASEFSASIEAIVGPTTFDVDATVDGWAFLQRFSL